MGGQRSPDDSILSLIDDVLNGEASAEQHRELEHRLLEDEYARKVYLRYINLHASLRGWFLSADSGHSDSPQHVSSCSTFLDRRWFVTSGLLAVSAICAAIGFLFGVRRRRLVTRWH